MSKQTEEEHARWMDVIASRRRQLAADRERFDAAVEKFVAGTGSVDEVANARNSLHASMDMLYFAVVGE